VLFRGETNPLEGRQGRSPHVRELDPLQPSRIRNLLDGCEASNRLLALRHQGDFRTPCASIAAGRQSIQSDRPLLGL
jgi:hypothetical protein